MGWTWCNNLRHYNSRTTQRAESVRASLKYTLRKNESLTSLLEKLVIGSDKGKMRIIFKTKVEMNTFPIAVFKEEIFEDLMGKLSHFALTMFLYNEYKQKKTKKNTIACAWSRRKFWLYCRHTSSTELSLDDITHFGI
ncbi:hypothetical protein BCR42DRAFT_399206 [Absidia repens]|uniref:Uncharacterized protein n=1 Tax=Absidia repens TaxID=90262 RepID=A0A1X2H8C8_9FUNG|nr:hypothetical protein BCR42DRAFT_399206 [Absidia repens]